MTSQNIYCQNFAGSTLKSGKAHQNSHYGEILTQSLCMANLLASNGHILLPLEAIVLQFDEKAYIIVYISSHMVKMKILKAHFGDVMTLVLYT